MIKKKKSPNAFEDWKSYRNPTSWNDLIGKPVAPIKRIQNAKYYSKQELRAELLTEQENLCCYCEREISNDPLAVKVDHIKPRSGNENLIFEYNNLGLSCSGGECDPKPRISATHCDTSKNGNEIPITPYDKRCEKDIDFIIKGNIFGKTENASKTIDVLNLDIPKLINLRSFTIAGIIFNDFENQTLISPNEATKIYNNLKSNRPTKYQTSVLRSLEKVMASG